MLSNNAKHWRTSNVQGSYSEMLGPQRRIMSRSAQSDIHGSSNGPGRNSTNYNYSRSAIGEETCIKAKTDEYQNYVQEVNSLEKVIKDEDSKRKNDKASEVKVLQKLYSNEEENEKETEALPHVFRDEDLRNLILYYMKLTFELRKKNSEGGDETSQNSDQDLKNDYYFVSTDYDSEEEATSSKSSFAPPVLKCKHCSKLLRGIHSLKNHCMRKHGNHSDKNILCDKCPTKFYTDFEFNRHYQTHYSVKNYLCHLCSKKFFQKSSLELHLRYHKNDRRYQCETCRKKFFTNNHLKRHCLTHTNRRDFRCEPCDRSFRYKDHLRRHLQSVHIGVRSHSCRECNKSFMYFSQLKFHEESHKEVPMKCSNCKKSFKKRISLKVHQRSCKE